MEHQVNYLSAVRSFEQTRAEADQAAKRLRLAASFLDKPRGVVVTGTGIDFDPRYTGPNPRPLAASEIPSAADVASLLARAQEAEARVIEVWDEVPEDERQGLTYPGNLGVGPRL